MLALISPDLRYRRSFADAIAEFEELNGKGDGGVTTRILASPHDAFGHYVQGLNRDPLLHRRYQYWWCDTIRHDWIGRVTLTLRRERHQLEIFIRPGRREQGHVTRILTATAPVALGLGADLRKVNVLLPADDHFGRWELETAQNHL